MKWLEVFSVTKIQIHGCSSILKAVNPSMLNTPSLKANRRNFLLIIPILHQRSTRKKIDEHKLTKHDNTIENNTKQKQKVSSYLTILFFDKYTSNNSIHIRCQKDITQLTPGAKLNQQISFNYLAHIVTSLTMLTNYSFFC